jgi:DNA-binding NarL/FixJ family response regulator
MRIKILLVDDHKVLRDGLRSILDSMNDIEIVGEAENGFEAIDIARALVPDVIVMDIGMKGLNGLDATREIKKDNPDVKIVALSAHSDKQYVLGMLEAGASGYVLKTCAVDEIHRAIRAVVEGNLYVCPDITGMVVEARCGVSPGSGALAGSTLGPRERQVLQLLAEGDSSPMIAKRLHIATSTVETHRRNLMRKLDVHSIAELTKYAIREGLTSLDP